MSELSRFAGPIHVDTDCGVDDALALVLVGNLAEVRSVTTTWGNCTACQAAANARHVLRHTHARRAPVTASDATPPKGWAASIVHGADGLGGVVHAPPDAAQPLPQAAAQAIVDFARRYGSHGRILSIAPLTNVAAAIALDPAAMASLGEVVVMAGHGSTPRNSWLDNTGDTNTHHDPDATRAVLTSGMRLTFVGIDQTRHVLLGEPDFGTTDLGRHLLSVSRHYGTARAGAYGYARSGPGWRVPAHDAVAACVLLGAGRHTTATMYVDDSSGSWVLRATVNAAADRLHHRVTVAGPTATEVAAIFKEALAP